MKIVNCRYCNKEMKTKYNIYCNNACQNSYQREDKLNRWLSGEWNPEYYAIPNVVRAFLLEEADYKCTSPSCAIPGGFAGINPASGKTVLTIDHIDGNADNNAKENLRVLCPNCHSMTSTFGGLNKGNGRSRRYKNVAVA